MCESKVYLFKEGREELMLDDVSYLCHEQDGLHLQNIYGEQRWIRARIKEIHLIDYRIILEEY